MKFIVSYSYLEKVRIKLNKEILEKKKKNVLFVMKSSILPLNVM